MTIPTTDYDTPTMPAALRRASQLWPDRDFVVTPRRRVTFAEADQLSRSLGHRLIDAGVGKGARVAFQYPNSIEWVVTWLAITRIGAVALPLSTTYTAAELRAMLRNGDAALLLIPGSGEHDPTGTLEETIPGLAESDASRPLRFPAVPTLRAVWVQDEEPPPWGVTFSPLEDHGPSNSDEDLFDEIEAGVSPADWMMVIHTSGTTGEPKGVVHTHGSAIRHGANLARFNRVDPDGRNLCSMPFFWVGGVGVNLTTSLATGSTVLCVERWDPKDALDLMEQEEATHIWMWGHHLRRFFEFVGASGRDVSGIPFFRNVDDLMALGTGLRHNSLGMTETWGPHTAAGPERERVLPEALRGSFGLPVPGVEHRVIDPETWETLPEGIEGEVCVRGYSLMAGMLKRERHEVFDDDGWVHTGDRGRFIDGCLIFSGRLTDMIKSAGANVDPREVEATLQGHPDVAMAFVLGVPDDERGEVVAAAVVPGEGRSPSSDDLERHIRRELSAYKVPRRWVFLQADTVPFLASGKPDILALAARLAEVDAPAGSATKR